jgi:hypothetical protein
MLLRHIAPCGHGFDWQSTLGERRPDYNVSLVLCQPFCASNADISRGFSRSITVQRRFLSGELSTLPGHRRFGFPAGASTLWLWPPLLARCIERAFPQPRAPR